MKASKEKKPLSGKEEIKRYLNESQSLERDLLAEKEKSSRNAWRVAYSSIGLACLGVIAGIAGLSQETPIPALLRVDSTTGAVESVSIQRETEVSYGEVVDSYFLNKYILNREGYDYKLIQDMYDKTALMSTGDAWESYKNIYSGPNSREIILGNKAEIIVNVRSIDSNSDTGIATIRYSTQKKYTNGIYDPIEYWVATASYTYVRAIMTTEERRVNPLGFIVSNYRYSPEVVRN